MLTRFEVANYRNFENTFVLDFTDCRNYEYSKECIKDGKLNKIMIYGKNGTGKSNFGEALLNLYIHLFKDKPSSQKSSSRFLNANSPQTFASFKYEFLIDNSQILYAYRKNQHSVLTYEKLVIDSNMIFEYDFEEKKLLESNLALIDAESLNFSYLDNLSILRYIANNASLDDTSIIKKLMDFIGSMLYLKSADENMYIGMLNGNLELTNYIIENNLVEELETYLSQAGIDTLLTVDVSPDGTKNIYCKFKNRSLTLWSIASSGTKALIALFVFLHLNNNITFLYLDEFDAFFHHQLSKQIAVSLRNDNRFQTVFTTHNTDLMTNLLLRPDCYFIMTKDRLVSLPNATDLELREGHNLEKLYHGGEFA